MAAPLPAFHVPMVGCPIESGLGTLGKKWSLVLLRDIVFFGRHRFTEFLAANDGLTPRVLSRRLQELVRDGFLDRRAGDGRDVRYELTAKGRDAIPILAALFQFGATHDARRVFADGRRHDLLEVFPAQQRLLLGPLLAYAQAASA